MVGGNWLNYYVIVLRWWYDIWNYYINIIVFFWLEVGYLCIGYKVVFVDYGNCFGYWVFFIYGKFVN